MTASTWNGKNMARLQISDPTGSEKGWNVAQGYPRRPVLPGNAPLPAKHINSWLAGFLGWLWLIAVVKSSALARFHGAAPCWSGHPHEKHMPRKNFAKEHPVISSNQLAISKECSRAFVPWCMQTLDTKKLTLLSVCINHCRQEFELKVEVLLWQMNLSVAIAGVQPRLKPKFNMINESLKKCGRVRHGYHMISYILYILPHHLPYSLHAAWIRPTAMIDTNILQIYVASCSE